MRWSGFHCQVISAKSLFFFFLSHKISAPLSPCAADCVEWVVFLTSRDYIQNTLFLLVPAWFHALTCSDLQHLLQDSSEQSGVTNFIFNLNFLFSLEFLNVPCALRILKVFCPFLNKFVFYVLDKTTQKPMTGHGYLLKKQANYLFIIIYPLIYLTYWQIKNPIRDTESL